MTFPTDAETGAVMQFEDFPLATEPRASVGPMWALFPLHHSYGDATDIATQRLFAKTMHTYYGMPMSSSNCAVWAARMGDRAEAIKALELGMATRMHEPFRQFVEAVPTTAEGIWAGAQSEPWLTKRTCFVTACGGFLTAALLGFPGLCFNDGDPQSWAQHPVILPEGWDAIEVDRLWARGQAYRLTATHGTDRSVLTPTSDAP